MQVITLSPKTGRLLDRVAGMPAGTPLALSSESGQPLFVGTRLSKFAAPLRQSLPETVGVQLLKAFLSPLTLFGLPVSAMIDGFLQQVRSPAQTTVTDLAALQTHAQPVTPQLDDFFVRLKKAQEARVQSPGKPPEVLRFGSATFTVRDDVTMMGKGLKVAGNALVPVPTVALAPHPQTTAIPEDGSANYGMLANAQRANDFVNIVGEGVDTFSKLYPNLGQQLGLAGDIVDGFGVLTSGGAFIDAFRRGDDNALVGCTLTLGAGALNLAGTFSGNPDLRNVALFLKFSKTGWTFFFPSKGKAGV